MLKKQRIWLLAFLVVISASCTRAAQEPASQPQTTETQVVKEPASQPQTTETQTVKEPAAQAPVAQEPTVASDLVYLKVEAVTTSSFDDTPDWAPPQNAMAPLDGDLNTRWASKLGIDNQWISFDFGKKKTVTLIKILWEKGYAVDYEILASDDGQSWQSLKVLKDQSGGSIEIPLESIATRYIKILGLKRANPEWGISMWEVEFYGPKNLNPDDKPIEEALPGHKSFTEELKQSAGTVMEQPLAGLGAMTAEEFQKGVVYTSWSRTELGESASDKTLAYLYSKGVRSIAIMVPWFQDTIDSKIIYPDTQKDTPTDEALAHVINTCHKLGLKVMLKPHVDTKDGAWRGDINPNDEWFISYEDFIVQYAKLAATYNVELYCIGTELANATIGGYVAKWDRIIGKIKEYYKGPLIYGANWNEYYYVSFWKQLDFIGIDAYFPLTSTKEPTLQQLTVSWAAIGAKIETWLAKESLQQPIVFTEIGYSSAEGTNLEPWKVRSGPDVKVDEQEQSDCLQALTEALIGKPWFKGMYWWQYFPQERFNPTGFIIRGKIAEGVLADWYMNKNK
jgi:hypothetical protein